MADTSREAVDALISDFSAQGFHDEARMLTDLLAERDALRIEREEIAAVITTEIPKVGDLWPMVSNISGHLAASRNLLKNEIAAHHATKAEVEILRTERDEARDEAYDLRLTILGGEDVPGLAGSIPLETVKELHNRHVTNNQWRAEQAEADRDRLREALRGFVRWAEQKCPCRNDEPNPCPLCGASVENLEACKAADKTLPCDLLTAARAALASKEPPA